jgi:pectinesterase
MEKCREKVEIPATMAYITLEGSGPDNTIIEWDDTADRTGKSGHPLGTFASATFAVDAPYFIAKNITFKVSQFRDLGFIICY